MFFYSSSTCRIDIPRLILVPSAHTRSGWGWLKKLESMALSCAEYWMAVRATFSGRLHFPAYPFLLTQIFSIPFLPFLPRRLWTGRGLNRPRLYPNTILYLHYSVWGIAFLGLGLWAPTNKWSWPKNCWAPQELIPFFSSLTVSIFKIINDTFV